MHLVSFAQNQEDIMLWRALRHVEKGFYIDVGAADPLDLSITRIFYDRGWRGINLEPNAVYFAALRKARPGDVNLPIGAGREAGPLTFYDVAESGLSTFDSSVAAGHAANGWTVTEQIVEILPLAEICRRYRPQGPIHFLKIDVEGSEADVLAGADFEAFRPWIVLVEATLPGSQIQSYEHWEGLLTGHGYTFAWFDGLNRFYISEEMRPGLEQHFRVPPNVFDGFEPSHSLFSRAEQAEQSLRETQAEATRHAEVVAEALRRVATDMARQSSLTAEATRHTEVVTEALGRVAGEAARQSTLTAEAQQHAHRLHQELEAMREQNAALSAKLYETGTILSDTRAALTATAGRLHDTLTDLSAALGRASLAELHVHRLLASTSWRVSAPLRAVRRMLPGYAESVSAAPVTPPGIPLSGKELARQVFHRGMRRLLALPGGRRAVRIARGVAPGAAEWLALRYRAYEQRAAHHARIQNHRAIPSTPAESVVAASVAPLAELHDLSEQEARLYRQLTTNDRAIAMAGAGA